MVWFTVVIWQPIWESFRWYIKDKCLTKVIQEEYDVGRQMLTCIFFLRNECRLRKMISFESEFRDGKEGKQNKRHADFGNFTDSL